MAYWPWHKVFGIAAWFIWKSRNEKVFGGGSGFSDYSIAAIRNMMVDTSIVNKGVDISGRKKSEVSWVGWEYSQEELFELNVDGCSKGNPGVAGAGGLIRDSMGTWMQNFAVNTGICTSVRAELWAVVTGLDLAWTLGLCQVILDTDSILVVGLITKSTTKSDSNNALITQVKEALAREWEIRVQHTLQEGNTAADRLANYGSIKNPFIRDRWIVHDLSAGLYSTLYCNLIG